MASLLSFFVVLILTIGMIGSGDGAYNVSYDGRSLIIDGEHRILFSGSIHYPRSTPLMWPSLVTKAKAGGLDVIDTYVFWNLHEPKQGQYDFSGRKDIVRFIKEIEKQGLYVCLRIGPYINGELSYGGLPFWLHDVPGIVFRSNNEPFKKHMEKYSRMIIDLMKSEKLFASQGGPIILSQIENEYSMVEKTFKENGKAYVKWAANLAVELQTGVPWVMCKQDDAPDPIINSCNGRRCGDTFAGPNSSNKPALWTENWTSFYEVYGNGTQTRDSADIAFHVALFIAKKKGSYVNYYMYHGGTNFGRSAAAYIRTSYYDQAPIDEYGMLRQPKWGHLKELHTAIKLSSRPLLYGAQKTISLGYNQQAFVFEENSDQCAAFLVNDDRRNEAEVWFRNTSYKLLPKSISILPDCKSVAFNTAMVNSQYNTRSAKVTSTFYSQEKWEQYQEVIPTFNETSLRATGLLEHMNTTKDTSDYLWYTYKLNHDSFDTEAALKLYYNGHALHAFVNRVHVGSAHGSFRKDMFTTKNTIILKHGTNYISLLSVMVGLPGSGPYLEKRVSGLWKVRLHNIADLTKRSSGYQVGLGGENLQIYTDDGLSKVKWSMYGSSTQQPLTWFKTRFDAPDGIEALALNLQSMGKGEAWVNGQSIGRYWVSLLNSQGVPSQTWYHVPRSFLKPTDNLLVIFEEEKGFPPGISLDTMSIETVCGQVSHTNPPTVISWRSQNQKLSNGHHRGRRPKLRLNCPNGKSISNILFASYGNPVGDCQTQYYKGSCHSSESLHVANRACLGKKKCTIALRREKFGDDPCPGIPKSLLVHAQCT